MLELGRLVELVRRQRPLDGPGRLDLVAARGGDLRRVGHGGVDVDRLVGLRLDGRAVVDRRELRVLGGVDSASGAPRPIERRLGGSGSRRGDGLLSGSGSVARRRLRRGAVGLQGPALGLDGLVLELGGERVV